MALKEFPIKVLGHRTEGTVTIKTTKELNGKIKLSGTVSKLRKREWKGGPVSMKIVFAAKDSKVFDVQTYNVENLRENYSFVIMLEPTLESCKLAMVWNIAP